MTFKTPSNTTVIQPVALATAAKFGSMDGLGRIRTSRHQNIYEADFEYGTQPMRWENYIISSAGGSSITHQPGQGGVRMRLGTANGDMTIRQTRPYHRYQPGKTLYMATAINFGAAQTGQRQRVGFFDDGNGMLLEQGDPIATATTNTQTGTLVSGNNLMTGLSNTYGFHWGMQVSGNNIPAGNTYVIHSVNSTALMLSQPATGSSTSNSYVFQLPANPSGMFAVMRSDVQNSLGTGIGVNGGVPNDIRVPIAYWNGDAGTISSIDWTRLQMIWMEYAWYGGGMLRWGGFINGEPVVLHYTAAGNRTYGTLSQQGPWSRTGNLPVRYEQRNLTTTTANNDMLHYGVSVVVEGGTDEQRGFTYSYGPTQPQRTVTSANTRFPVLSVRPRTMGTIEASGNSSFNAVNSSSNTTTLVLSTANASWSANQFVGRHIFFPGLTSNSAAIGITGRITFNNTSAIGFVDVITNNAIANTPPAGQAYQIGLINRGQLLPKTLFISANNATIIELISSTPNSPVVLTGQTWFTLANTAYTLNTANGAAANVQQALMPGSNNSGLGSNYSFAERDVNATAITGGEVVFALVSPAGGSGLQQIDLSYFFPLYNTIAGGSPDILTLAATTTATTAIGVHLIAQEAMS